MMQRYLLLFILLFTLPILSQAQTVEFVRNDGQWDGPFAYYAHAGNGRIYLSGDTFTYVLGAPGNAAMIDRVHHGYDSSATLNFHSYRTVFVGAAKPAIVAGKEQSWYYNYFLGNDQKKWKSGIHPALALDYKGLYPGVDMHLSSQNSNLKYEFQVAPGADAGQIKLKFEGADGIRIKNGSLLIHTTVGDVQELQPYAYQYAEGGQKKVACRYRLRDNTISYELTDDYDHSKLLIIDPTVVFATFSGSTADNWGFTATYDAQGNFYAGGLANPVDVPGTFPTTPGAFQSVFGGGVTDFTNTNPDHGSDYTSDITIMKFNPTGTTKIYATYLGGNDNDQPHSMIVDAAQNLIVAGRSFSTNFPVTASGYDQTANGKGDIIVTKFNAGGTALLGSTYIGGSADDGVNFDGREPLFGNLKHNYGDDARSEVLIDNANNVYVTASTKSTDFPVTANAFQSANAGAQDGVIFKLNATLSTLIWSTYIGGSNDDAGYVLALDGTQANLYVAGGTQSANFPAVGGGWRPAYQGGSADGYILKFTNSGNYPLTKSTFIGTGDYDQCYGVQVDFDNNVYAMGQTLGGTFPVTSGVYSNPGSSQFIIKMNPNLTTNIYSTVFGSGTSTSTNISPVAFLVDTCQNVYISGWGGNLGFPYPGVGTTNNMPLSTINTPAQSTTDGSDFYFFVLGKNGQSFLYGSYFGGTGPVGEHVDGGTSRFDKNGVIYQAICGGCGGSSNFPTTPGSWSVTNSSANCNLIALKIAFNLGAVDAGANASPNAKGCPPFTVQFTNTSVNATTYTWDFKDGSPVSNLPTPQHTFTNVGTYRVKLTAFNPDACTTTDSAFLTIVVDSTRVHSGFTYAVKDSCWPYTVLFNNTSSYSSTPGSQGFTKFIWLFGDNTSYTGVTPPLHSYPNGGTFTVSLIQRDTTACNSPDTSRQTFTLNSSSVAANFNAIDSLCEGAPVVFSNTSQNAKTNSWDFGDSTTSNVASPAHIYKKPGTYTVKLVVKNPDACNKVDSLTKSVTVREAPTADFTFSPTVPIPNSPIDFHNTSLNAIDYTWSFGDNTNSTEVNPSHLYRKKGTYTVCLEARNRGCRDTVCHGVVADVQTGAELPTAFSPNGDGSNDIFYVRGGAIETSTLRVFNRWGQVVFESENAPPNDPKYGWDGTYKGKAQEVEVYGWVLTVSFIDGTTAQRKGNVTLLR